MSGANARRNRSDGVLWDCEQSFVIAVDNAEHPAPTDCLRLAGVDDIRAIAELVTSRWLHIIDLESECDAG